MIKNIASILFYCNYDKINCEIFEKVNITYTKETQFSNTNLTYNNNYAENPHDNYNIFLLKKDAYK